MEKTMIEERYPMLLSHPTLGREGFILFSQDLSSAKREAKRIHSRYASGWKLELYDAGKIAYQRIN
jgi:hypothetical protein